MFSFSSTEKILIVALEKQISCRFQKIQNAGNCQNKEKKLKPTSGVAVVYYLRDINAFKLLHTRQFRSSFSTAFAVIRTSRALAH